MEKGCTQGEGPVFKKKTTTTRNSYVMAAVLQLNNVKGHNQFLLKDFMASVAFIDSN